MARPTISRSVDRVTIISASTAATAAPALQVRDQNFPTGDQGCSSLLIRYDGVISGTSTPTRITNGHIFFMTAITVETDKHGKMVDAVDGLLMYNFNIFEYGTTGVATALSATPADSDTPEASWKIPFRLPRGVRPYDTHLDMSKARMKVSTQYGIGGAPSASNPLLWSQAAGSPVLTLLRQSIEAKILPGPLDASANNSELPSNINVYEQKSEIITATETRHQVQIPFGDRIWKRLLITQRNSASKIELSTVVVSTAEVSLYVNNVPVVDRRLWRDIQAENKMIYGFETSPTGVIALDFDDDLQEKINDMLWTLTTASGSMFLYIDVTSVTNGSLLLGYNILKPIPDAALRG